MVIEVADIMISHVKWKKMTTLDKKKIRNDIERYCMENCHRGSRNLRLGVTIYYSIIANHDINESGKDKSVTQGNKAPPGSTGRCNNNNNNNNNQHLYGALQRTQRLTKNIGKNEARQKI